MSENIKTRKYYRVHNGESWDRMHFVTDANSVDANDGDNMETKVGAIKGITTSTEVTEEGYAADATVVAALNSSLGGLEFSIDTDGKGQYRVSGDSDWKPFLSVSNLEMVEDVYYRFDGSTANISTSLTVPSDVTFGIIAITVNVYFAGNTELTGNGIKNIISRTVRPSTSNYTYDNGLEFILCEFNPNETINISASLTNGAYHPGLVATIIKIN